MDPDAALIELLDAARAVTARRGQEDIEDQPQLVALAEGVMALHTWITTGGFLPAAWRATVGPHYHGMSAAEHGGE